MVGFPATAEDLRSTRLLDHLLSLHPRHIDLHLDRIERLLAALGRPQDRLPPVFHVAGTNGKGSTVALLKAMLEADGRSIHCYTSPHLVSFHERIVLNGVPITEQALCDVLETCERVNDGQPITYFEITTAAAIVAFAERSADALILEVGLGGRLDATNVVARPASTLIMPVDMDHQNFLGDRLDMIAREKAGILKKSVPGIISRQHDVAREVIEEEAEKVGAPLLIFGQDFSVHEENGRLVYQDEGGLLDLPLPRLPGRHQLDNAATAIAALRHQNVVPIGVEGIEGGLREVHWPGRLQRLTRGPLVRQVSAAATDPADGGDLWLDGGHNPHAGEAVSQFMADLDQRVPRALYIVCAMLANKDADGYLAHFAGLARHLIAVPLPGGSEGWAPSELCASAERVGLSASAAEDVDAAMRRILQMAHEDAAPAPRILICGSLYLAGAVLADHA